MFVPRDASSHVARNACSHVCGTDRDGEPLGQMATHEVRGQHTACGCNGGGGGACLRCKRVSVTCASFKSWALRT